MYVHYLYRDVEADVSCSAAAVRAGRYLTSFGKAKTGLPVVDNVTSVMRPSMIIGHEADTLFGVNEC